MDDVPVFSQIKSLAQWATGNKNGAEETQNNVLKLCPVISQGTSIVQAICGNGEGVRETQIKFMKGVSGMLDSVPVVRHVKATLHYVCGDKEGNDNAMKAASHTTGVIGGGVGFMVGGPVGAAAGGAAGGILMDDIISLAEVAINGEKKSKPYGFVENVLCIANVTRDGGNYVDLIGGTVLDGMP